MCQSNERTGRRSKQETPFEPRGRRASADTAARHHLWDRYTGAYVLGTRDKETGDSLDVYMDVHKKTGTALRNGVPLGDEDSRKHVENADAAHIHSAARRGWRGWGPLPARSLRARAG